jgi:hypothetical protein
MALSEQYNPDSSFLEKKLLRLVYDLEQKINLDKLSTEDEFFAAVNEMLWDLYTHLKTPNVDRKLIQAGDIVSPNTILKLVKGAIRDLQESYDRIEDSQAEILRRNNRYASLIADVKARVQNTNSVLSTISRNLENNTFEITDTFADDTMIVGSSTGPSLHLNPDAGILTLPQITSTDIKIANIKILSSSNGDIMTNNPLDAAIDGNLDTWFEYRRNAELDDNALILELLISLQTVNVINQIQIFPLIQDDRAFPHIEEISTSLDGRVYESIRTSLPTFLTKDEEDSLFVLGPVGFRNQDHADFNITPRTCQFIRIRIRQGKKINLGGQILRIALRDITIRQIEYDVHGETISRTFPLSFIPRKLKLVERAVETKPLSSLTYQISFDQGIQWFDILPDTEVEINTGAPNALDLSGEIQGVSLKIIGDRDSTKFNGLAKPLAGTTHTVTNRISINGVPSTLGLENIPIDGTLILSRPVASVGTDYAYPLIKANGEPNLVVDLPISIRPFSETVKLNGQAWTRVASFEDGGPTDQWYTIDYQNRKIQFADARQSMLAQGQITLQLDPEILILPDTSPLTVDLEYAHDFNPEHIKIYWYDRIRSTKEEALRRGITHIQLQNYPIVPSIDVDEDVPLSVNTFYLANIPATNAPVVFSDKSVFKSRVDTVPAITGEYSIVPLVSGILSPVLVTTFDKTNNLNAGIVSFESTARILAPSINYNSDQWLKDIGFPTLGNLSDIIEIHGIRFSDTNIFKTEYSFIDGTTELNQTGDYTVDYENGKIYSFAPTSEQDTTYVLYNYQTRKTLNWEFVSGNPSQLIINDDNFLVTKNDKNSVALKNSDGSYSLVVYKDNRYIRIPIGTTSPYQSESRSIEFTDTDFIKGYILPEGKSRVRLPHQAIVKNSIRFLFLSDDINAYDDRIVTRYDDGVTLSITVLPKPIRDVYGNSLIGTLVGARTQRDVDKLTLVRERRFIDGNLELEQNGDYSVDYRAGILYTFNTIPANVVIQYEYSDIRATYVATEILQPDTQYILDLSTLSIQIISLDAAAADLTGSTLLLRYDVIDQLKEDPVRIAKFYTPLLMGYELRIKSL